VVDDEGVGTGVLQAEKDEIKATKNNLSKTAKRN
jgi:hypothetical protein